MCGPIQSSYLKNQFPTSSGVQQDGQNYYSIGDYSTVVWGTAQNGSNSLITASFTGGDGNRTYQINFSCKQGALNDGKGLPTFVSEVTPGNYLFEWSTVFACASPPHDCTVYFQNLQFDLSPLRNDSVDYKITSDNDGTFFINICGPLVDSSVCGADNSEDDAIACLNYNNQQSVLATADSVSFNYNKTGEAITATYFGGFQGRTVVYTILCDQNTTGPSYFGKGFNNAYNFFWRSPVACQQNSTI